MGADGHISIWKHSEVIEAFSDAAKLFMCLPNTYKDTLDGIEYWHSYWGDNLGDYWACREDWLLDNDVDFLRLAEFVGWLSANYTEWEVWVNNNITPSPASRYPFRKSSREST
jgi:hypothetical protein